MSIKFLSFLNVDNESKIYHIITLHAVACSLISMVAHFCNLSNLRIEIVKRSFVNEGTDSH